MSDSHEYFHKLNAFFEQKERQKQAVQEVASELHSLNREIVVALLQLQQAPTNEQIVSKAVTEVKQLLTKARPLFDRIVQAVAEEPIDSFSWAWRSVMSELCFAVAYVNWLENRKLVNKEDIDAALGLSQGDTPSPIRVDVEEYLFGLCSLPKELARLCLNAVRDGDFNLPKEVNTFVQELYSGFRLLNLRNDNLRRKFDAIKYDVQRIEEVLYDITVRKLASQDGEEKMAE